MPTRVHFDLNVALNDIKKLAELLKLLAHWIDEFAPGLAEAELLKRQALHTWGKIEGLCQRLSSLCGEVERLEAVPDVREALTSAGHQMNRLLAYYNYKESSPSREDSSERLSELSNKLRGCLDRLRSCSGTQDIDPVNDAGDQMSRGAARLIADADAPRACHTFSEDFLNLLWLRREQLGAAIEEGEADIQIDNEMIDLLLEYCSRFAEDVDASKLAAARGQSPQDMRQLVPAALEVCDQLIEKTLKKVEASDRSDQQPNRSESIGHETRHAASLEESTAAPLMQSEEQLSSDTPAAPKGSPGRRVETDDIAEFANEKRKLNPPWTWQKIADAWLELHPDNKRVADSKDPKDYVRGCFRRRYGDRSRISRQSET